jgi:exosome complex exonuclease DIS3/RRP44
VFYLFVCLFSCIHYMCVYLLGSKHINRAVDGDVVAIKLLDAADLQLYSLEQGDEGDGEEGEAQEQEQVGVKDSTAAPSAEALEGIATSSNQGTTAGNIFSSSGGGGGGGAAGAQQQLFGRVVGILRRNWRAYAGSLDIKVETTPTGVRSSSGSGSGIVTSTYGLVENSGSSDSVLFAPVNKRIPRILISTRRLKELSCCRLLVCIDTWSADSAHPQGHLVEVLGPAGDKTVETKVLLHEFDVPYEAFSDEVMACLPPSGMYASVFMSFVVCIFYRL